MLLLIFGFKLKLIFNYILHFSIKIKNILYNVFILIYIFFTYFYNLKNNKMNLQKLI
jgi:hypothetical protein